MEAEAKYTYVGIAVIALAVALVMSVIWLKRTGAERDFARYVIYFERQALDGLAVGSNVSMRGISIGSVLDYQLSTERLNRARVDVRLDRRAPVRTNTYAAPDAEAPLSLPSPFTPVAALDSNRAPTTAVLPSTATLKPKRSPLPVLEAFRYACWLQVVPLRTKT